jgi:hypothetical protein
MPSAAGTNPNASQLCALHDLIGVVVVDLDRAGYILYYNSERRRLFERPLRSRVRDRESDRGWQIVTIQASYFAAINRCDRERRGDKVQFLLGLPIPTFRAHLSTRDSLLCGLIPLTI